MSNLSVIVNNPTDTVKIGERTYHVETFSVYKDFLTAQRLMEVLREAGVTDVVTVIQGDGVRPGIDVNYERICKLVTEELPRLVSVAGNGFYNLLALILTPNTKLEEIEVENKDLEEELSKEGRYIKHRVDLNQALDVVLMGIDHLQIGGAKKKLTEMVHALTGTSSDETDTSTAKPTS